MNVSMIKERMMSGLLASAILAGAMLSGGTQLTYEGKTIFESEKSVSFGATYNKNAIKAVVNAKEVGKIAVRTETKPVRVFVNREVLDGGKWSYAEDAKMVSLTVTAGMTDIQFRFDDMSSLKPIEMSFPVVVNPAADGKPLNLTLRGINADEKFNGKVAWPEEGEAGLYEIAVPEGVVLKTINAASVSDNTYYMRGGSALQIETEAPGGKIPALTITAKCVGNAITVKALDRVKLLERQDIVKLEGEAYARISGGEVMISKEHKNTSDGGCIFNWGTAGTRLEWDVDMAEAGAYRVAFVTACEGVGALRTFALNGKPVANARLISFNATGGWGRSNPKDWQAFEAVGADGKPVTVNFNAGKNTLALENFGGQHMNLDCIVLFK